jgi:hypothetical protein
LEYCNLITYVLKIFLFGLVRGSFQFTPQSLVVPPAFFIVDILPFPSLIEKKISLLSQVIFTEIIPIAS